MKVADFISKTIQEHPLFYKDIDYEKSKLKVLNTVFFNYGTGLELADTESPGQGGYIVEPKYKKDKKIGDYVRVKDKPYGKDKYKSIPDGYFENIVYYVYASHDPLQVVGPKES